MIGTVSYKSGFSFSLPLSLCAAKDGTLPFDPQKIAEGILEEVQNTHAVHAPDAPRKREPVSREKVEEAIKWLNSRSRLNPEKTRLNLYLEKQAAHQKSSKRKEDSYKEALEMSKRDPRNKTANDQRASYDRWIAENHRRLTAAIQAAHMDWVTTANKTDVEYHLGLIDLDLNKAITKVLETQAHASGSRKLAS
ncbi:hypothetical protein BJ322DRAFT_648635 [Thelephora terrestris]|uniref:Uncharacterized protein n=1 Tax=Thelephora terrestris TaxID=56493 RepID=A0A9P6HLG2_9AGAM|nr:hypothetical protein BJ322DRAFT_648635 [Thelephora terrestris]